MDEVYLGEQYNDWTVIGIIDKYTALCRCKCGKLRNVTIYNLKTGRSKSCGCTRYKHKESLLHKKFGEWEVIDTVNVTDRSKVLCRCSCGVIKEQYIKNLKDGTTKSCGHTKRSNLEGQQFGEWTVLKELGNSKILCKCSCGTIKELYKKAVKNGQTKSCGCKAKGYKDLTSKLFGSWRVDKYAGNGKWICTCTNCGNIKEQYAVALTEGRSLSCGCMQGENLKNTMMKYYGEIASQRINNPREKWKIDTLHNKEKFTEYINKLGFKPTIFDLCQRLDIQESTMLIRVHELGLDELVDLKPTHSKFEDEIVQYIKGITKSKVVTNTREIINKLELDIYIPDKGIAIEFNGNYWHDSEHKDKNYHLNKTLMCSDKGIRLIHIFEYEWINNKDNILKLIYKLLCDSILDVKTSELNLGYLDDCEVKKFFNENSIFANHKTDINIGFEYNNNIVQAVSLVKMNNYYAVSGMCTYYKCNVTGGYNQIIKFIQDNTEIDKIVAYCDKSKFTGQTYREIGFNLVETSEPSANYIIDGKYVRSDKIDDSIIHECTKIYNCGYEKYSLNL